MFEDDNDAILPEGFEDTPTYDLEADTQEPELDDQVDPNAEDTKPADEPTEPQEPALEPRKLKLTYNGQELEVDESEAVELAQKGKNYERAIERARTEAAQQAKDDLIASLGYEWNGKPITTEAEYKRAIAEKDLLDKYSQLPPELAQELIESRRFREEQQREREAKAAQDKQNADFNDFLGYFESVNERRFDPQKDTLPQEVLAAVNNGQTLRSAYMEYHNKELRNQLKIAKQNEANTKKAPVGSVTAGGGIKTEAEDDFLAGFNSI